jgi:transcriptional regulator with XRE-family HTH domain
MARTSAQQKLGKKLQQLRKEHGLTQEKLGELSGLDRGYISGVERGVRNPAIRNIEKLAKALKIKVSELTEF